MKDFFKSLFGASSKEITGFAALIIILVISLLIPGIINWQTAEDDSHWLEDQIMLDSLVALLEKERNSRPDNPKIHSNIHHFNPNYLIPHPQVSLMASKLACVAKYKLCRQDACVPKIQPCKHDKYQILRGSRSD